MVATQLLISLLWSVEYEAAGRIRFINSNQAAGRTKFYRGPDLARGPDFGHAWSMRLVCGKRTI